MSSQAFGADDNPTIYYLIGHGGRISQYKWHIKYLARKGWRVLAFEYDPLVLMSGDPQRLPRVADELTQAIKQDMAGRKVAGLYGISLGTFLGLNVMARLKIKKGMFNTGPAILSAVVWDVKGFAPVKGSFIAHDQSRKDVEKAWKPIEMPTVASGLKGAELVFMNSRDDNIITFDNYRQTYRLLEQNGIVAREIITKHFGHVGAIFRNILRLRIIKKFFK